MEFITADNNRYTVVTNELSKSVVDSVMQYNADSKRVIFVFSQE